MHQRALRLVVGTPCGCIEAAQAVVGAVVVHKVRTCSVKRQKVWACGAP